MAWVVVDILRIHYERFGVDSFLSFQSTNQQISHLFQRGNNFIFHHGADDVLEDVQGVLNICFCVGS